MGPYMTQLHDIHLWEVTWGHARRKRWTHALDWRIKPMQLCISHPRLHKGQKYSTHTIYCRMAITWKSTFMRFFFKQGMVGYDNLDQLFLTLVYQLAINRSVRTYQVSDDRGSISSNEIPHHTTAKPHYGSFEIATNTLSFSNTDYWWTYEYEEEEFHNAFLVLIFKVLLDPAVVMRFIIPGLSGYQCESISLKHLILVWLVDSWPFSHTPYGCYIGTAFFSPLIPFPIRKLLIIEHHRLINLSSVKQEVHMQKKKWILLQST